MANHLTLETEVPLENGGLRMTAEMEYKITVARIEMAAPSELEAQVCVTFQVERTPISFQIPVFLSARDFDDTEMVQVARNALHRTFMELAAASVDWELPTAELQRLSNLNLRPEKLAECKDPCGKISV
jgi:hypothetical protein